MDKATWWAPLRKTTLNTVTVISAPAVGVIALFAISLWFLQFVGDPEQTSSYAGGSPFTLAQVMAILGAFGIAGGFSSVLDSSELKPSLQRVGALYTLSALAFSLLGMMLPIVPAASGGTSHTFLVWVTGAAFLVAAVTFVLGTMELLVSIRKLLTADKEG